MDEVRTSELIAIARKVSQEFPDLDLRFNICENGSTIRLLAPDLTEHPIDLDANIEDSQQILYEAILAVKEVAKRFDA